MASAAAEYALQQESTPSSGMLQLIIAACPDLIYVYDRLEERYVFVSDRITAILGYTPEQIAQLTSDDVLQLVHPEDLTTVQAHYARQKRLTDADVSMTTYRVRHALGDYRVLRCRQKVFSRNAHGEAKCILGVATDITEELRRKVELDELRKQVSTIRESERHRLALEMHNTAVQHLVGAALMLHAIESQLQNPEASATLSVAQAALSSALQSILKPLGAEPTTH
jgi:PAS domain S-box-containing protein